MRFRSAVALFLMVFGSGPASALEWEIERNFRYFAYPSDVAVQRVARDLYVAKNGAAPTPEQSERQMNDAGFWSTELAGAGDLAKRWPTDWPRAGTIYDLVKRLVKTRAASAGGPTELARCGWASLLAPGPSLASRPARQKRAGTRRSGYTATARNGATTCARWAGS